MYAPVLVTPPAAAITLVTLDEVKTHVNASDFTDDDTMLTGFLNAAVSLMDGYTGILGQCLLTQSWRQDFDCLHRCLRLPLFPVSAIVSVKYDDLSGVEQTISASNYSLQTDARGAYVQFKTTYTFVPTSIERPAVRVAYAAGYANAAAVPDAIKTAIKLLIGHWYANRDAVIADNRVAALVLPFAVDALLAPFRRLL